MTEPHLEGLRGGVPLGRTLNLTLVFFKLIIPRNIVEQEEPGFLFCSTGVTIMIPMVIILLYLCGIIIKPQPRPILSSQARVESCGWTDSLSRSVGFTKDGFPVFDIVLGVHESDQRFVA